MKLTKKQVKEQQKEITGLFKSTDREGIDNLIECLEQTDYFTAPASSKPERHGCHEGGLAHHSLNVYTLFREKIKRFGLEIADDEAVIASLCHDFCKIGIYHPNVLKNGKISTAKPYVIKDPFPFGHGERSALLASRHIKLTPNEALLIRWHMGAYDPAFEMYHNQVDAACPAVYAFQAADHEATRYLDLRKVKNPF